jgi:hypothetical protein
MEFEDCYSRVFCYAFPMLKKNPGPPFKPAPTHACMCRSGKIFGECCGSKATDRKPPIGALLYPGFIDPDICKKWVRKLEGKRGVPATVNAAKQLNPHALTKEKSADRICSNVNPGVLRKIINDRVLEAFQMTAKTTGRSVAWFERPSILRYTSGGYHKSHADSCDFDAQKKTWMKVRDRDISLLFYLNEEFTGGGLTFTKFNYHLRPRAGDLLVFPSDNRYQHQAEVVQSGVRYVIVSWAAFKGSPRVQDSVSPKAIHLP